MSSVILDGTTCRSVRWGHLPRRRIRRSSLLCLGSNIRVMRALWVSSALSLIGGVHIGAIALLDINLIWFGYIARLSQWGGGGYFPGSYHSTCLRCTWEKGGWGGQHPVFTRRQLTKEGCCQRWAKWRSSTFHLYLYLRNDRSPTSFTLKKG